MNLSSVRRSRPVSRLLVAALSCLTIGNACSSDHAAPPAPITFGIEVSSLDGHAVNDQVDLRCDHGGPGVADAAGAFSTLAVSVSVTPIEAGRNFVLSPANACGTSTRCGFVRIEALDASDGVLAQTDTVTTEGVLKLALDQLPDLKQIRVSLVRGFDLELLQNPDNTAVAAAVTPTFALPTDCVALPSSGGAGAGGDTGTGGASNETASAGAGGDTATPALGGAGGDTATPGLGGAADSNPATGGIGGA